MLHCQLLSNNCTFKNLDLIKKWFLTWLEHEKFTISEQEGQSYEILRVFLILSLSSYIFTNFFGIIFFLNFIFVIIQNFSNFGCKQYVLCLAYNLAYATSRCSSFWPIQKYKFAQFSVHRLQKAAVSLKALRIFTPRCTWAPKGRQSLGYVCITTRQFLKSKKSTNLPV
jgi:hypothetical protein